MSRQDGMIRATSSPAESASAAHALMESSTHIGKIVLTWQE